MKRPLLDGAGTVFIFEIAFSIMLFILYAFAWLGEQLLKVPAIKRRVDEELSNLPE